MNNYIIFIAAPINMSRSHYQNSRRGEKAIDLTGSRADLLAKVQELRAAGERVLSVRTYLGGWVRF